MISLVNLFPRLASTAERRAGYQAIADHDARLMGAMAHRCDESCPPPGIPGPVRLGDGPRIPAGSRPCPDCDRPQWTGVAHFCATRRAA